MAKTIRLVLQVEGETPGPATLLPEHNPVLLWDDRASPQLGPARPPAYPDPAWHDLAQASADYHTMEIVEHLPDGSWRTRVWRIGMAPGSG
jgi:hypothetical protein